MTRIKRMKRAILKFPLWPILFVVSPSSAVNIQPERSSESPWAQSVPTFRFYSPATGTGWGKGPQEIIREICEIRGHKFVYLVCCFVVYVFGICQYRMPRDQS